MFLIHPEVYIKIVKILGKKMKSRNPEIMSTDFL